jgi:hypothetical protein
MPIPSDEAILDASEEIERCLWRANEGSRDSRKEWLGEMDSEVMSILRGLSDQERLIVLDRVVAHQEDKAGMPQDLIEEVFNYAALTREDLNAFRLSQQTPQAQAPRSTPRI